MSADNGIYVLETIRNTPGFGKHKVYRVSCVSAIENFDYYQEHSERNHAGKLFDKYISENWPTDAYNFKETAMMSALDKQESFQTEYGIYVIRPDDAEYIHPLDRNL